MTTVYPLNRANQFEEGVEISAATVSEALKVTDAGKGHIGFAFGKASEDTRYLFAERLFDKASDLPGEVYTGMQVYLGVQNTTSPQTVVYESPHAYCLLTADKQPKTILVNRAGKQLFPKPTK